MLPIWVESYIGIPFDLRGRTREGCDCYGLVRLVLLEQFNKLLPLFDNSYTDQPSEEAMIRANMALLSSIPTEEPTVGTLVLLRYLGRLSHIAMFVGDGYILHSEERKQSHLSKIDTVGIRDRIGGYYNVH